MLKALAQSPVLKKKIAHTFKWGVDSSLSAQLLSYWSMPVAKTDADLALRDHHASSALQIACSSPWSTLRLSQESPGFHTFILRGPSPWNASPLPDLPMASCNNLPSFHDHLLTPKYSLAVPANLMLVSSPLKSPDTAHTHTRPWFTLNHIPLQMFRLWFCKTSTTPTGLGKQSLTLKSNECKYGSHPRLLPARKERKKEATSYKLLRAKTKSSLRGKNNQGEDEFGTCVSRGLMSKFKTKGQLWW